MCNRLGHIQCECPEKIDTRPDPETMTAAKCTTATLPAKGQKGRTVLELAKELRHMNNIKRLCLGRKLLHLTQNKPAMIARTSFIQSLFLNNVFLPRKNSLHIPLTYHTAMKSTPMTVFIDCGATECFISQEFINAHKLGTRKLYDPRLLQNADGSANMGGNITNYADLKITTGDKVAVL